jgi:hypothetical protein
LRPEFLQPGHAIKAAFIINQFTITNSRVDERKLIPMTISNTKQATPSAADLLLRISKQDATAWEQIVRRYVKLISATLSEKN